MHCYWFLVSSYNWSSFVGWNPLWLCLDDGWVRMYGCMDVGTHWSTVHCTVSIPALQSNWTPVKGNVSCLCKYLTGSGGALVLLQHPSKHNPHDEERMVTTDVSKWDVKCQAVTTCCPRLQMCRDNTVTTETMAPLRHVRWVNINILRDHAACGAVSSISK